MAQRPFRFAIQTSNAPSGDAWREKARKIEDLGFSALLMPDHFGDQLSPLPAFMAAADATTTLRVGGLVLDNDFKHPLVLAKEIATLDVLSGGRVEIGIGAGWMTTDYDASGIAYDTPGGRVSRLQESVKIMKGLFGEESFSFSGDHYTVTNANGLPKPVQKPHPPIMIGGGGKRVLRFAAREADIISVNFNLQEGAVGAATMATGTAEATREKIGWIRDAAGSRFKDIELNVTIFATIVTDDASKIAERVATEYCAHCAGGML
ncbi:MAG: TIGR03621 family F420-dependent LLM class oxidoreductase, partial [Dehalococcoidia bacterium]